MASSIVTLAVHTAEHLRPHSVQQTLLRAVSWAGIGLHTGAQCKVTVSPAVESSGIRIAHAQGGRPEALEIARVVDSVLCTRLELSTAKSISTVEHLLSALAGLNIDNADIVVDGPEVPILDGSALPFARGLHEAGIVTCPAQRALWEVTQPVEVKEGTQRMRIEPPREPGVLTVDMTVDFTRHSAIVGKQLLHYRAGDPTAYMRDIAPARTFTFEGEIAKLRKAGLIAGGSLDCAVVYGTDSVINGGELRFPDEVVRHKMLDVIGDLALAGRPVAGHIEVEYPGHKLTHTLLRQVIERKAFRVVKQ